MLIKKELQSVTKDSKILRSLRLLIKQIVNVGKKIILRKEKKDTSVFTIIIRLKWQKKVQSIVQLKTVGQEPYYVLIKNQIKNTTEVNAH